MNIFVGVFIATVTIAAAGFGTTMLLTHSRLTIWENVALAWLFGTALVSLSLWIGGFLFRGIALQILVAAVCVTIGVIGVRRWRTFSREARSDSRTKANIIFVTLLVVELVSIFWLSFQRTLGEDGLLVWEMKARYAFLNGGALPIAFFGDTSRWFSNPDYPLLLPLTETWFYSWIGDAHQFWIKLIFPFWYVAAISILWFAGSELTGKRWIGWMLVLLFPLVPCIHDASGGFQTGYAGAPLAAIYLASIFYLLRFIRDGSRDALALFIALAATLPWMKREGAILWAAISIAGAIAIWSRRNIATAALSFLPGLCIIAAWKSFLSVVHCLPPQDFFPVGPGVLRNNIQRTGPILHQLGLQLIGWHNWSIFWLLVAFAVLGLVIRERSVRVGLLLWLLLVPLACFCSTYYFSVWPDYIVHIRTSLMRLLIELTPVGWLLIAVAFAEATFGGGRR